MSNFLSNFDSKEYKQEEPITSKVEEENELEEPIGKRRHETEKTEFDPQYNKKRKKKRLLVIVLAILAVIISGVVYYQMSRVSMPNFQGKNKSEVQKWAAQNKMKLIIEEEFNSEIDSNSIIKQPKKVKQKVKKGSELTFSVSKGANPDDKIVLPDFSKMKLPAVEDWVKKEHLENVVVVTEYDETVPKDAFIREEFTNEGSRENFKRSDNGKILYSKGKEVYQKDISVPDFKGKTLPDVETWSKKNDITLEVKKVSSDSVPIGQVVEQSIKEKEKIAKKTKMTINISAGKGSKVPDFSNFTKENAASQGKLQVTVEERYNPEVPYGELLSQSVLPETELTEEDNLTVKVVYSAGKPYLKDLTGQNEGELQKIFFDEFRSKGANIYYVVNYVESDAPKGQIVSMDTSNTFLPLDYTVTINVSLGAKK